MLGRAEARRIRGLSRRRQREREGLFVAEGVRVVEELLTTGVVLRTALVTSSLGDTERGARLRARLERLDGQRGRDGGGDGAAVVVHEADDTLLRDLGGTSTPQGVLVVGVIPRVELSALRPSGASVVLVLDGVQDPGNLGTLARSAAAFGCEAVVCLPGTVDPWNPKSVRASAGSLFRLPVVQTSPMELGEWLARHGYLLAAAEAGAPAIGTEPLPQRVALVLGNEGAGLTEEVAATCERRLSIPMKGGTESLNVAVAGAILLYELTRERE